MSDKKPTAFVLVGVEGGNPSYQAHGNVEVAVLDYDLLQTDDKQCLQEFINAAEGMSVEFLEVIDTHTRKQIQQDIENAKIKIVEIDKEEAEERCVVCQKPDLSPLISIVCQNRVHAGTCFLTHKKTCQICQKHYGVKE